jgi:plasmid stabilization system protein ParE
LKKAGRYRLSARAIDDLDSIWSYIAKDSVQAANRVESALFAGFDLLSRNPRIGSARPELTPRPVRFWAVPKFRSFIVVYSPEPSPIRVLTILHGMRNIEAILLDPEFDSNI